MIAIMQRNSKMSFGLCFFHALILGRRRFGQQGWSRAYGFNTGDLKICANVLTSYLDAAPEHAEGGCLGSVGRSSLHIW